MATDFSKYGVPVDKSKVKGTTDFSKYGTPVGSASTGTERQQRIEQGLPVGMGDRATPTMGGEIVRGVAKLPARIGTSLTQIGQLAGDIAGVDTGTKLAEPFSGEYLGKVTPVGGGVETGFSKKALIDSIGSGVEAASYVVGGAPGVKTVANTIAQPLKKTALKTGLTLAKEGALQGGLSSLGTSMQDGDSLGQTLKNTAVGTVAGAGLGFAGGYGGSKISSKIKTRLPKNERIIAGREGELANIETNYAKTRKAAEYSKDASAGSRRRVAETDVLVNATDDNGIIRTKNPGGAVEKYKAQTLDGAEQVVRNNLERLGEKVNLSKVEKELTDAVNASGLEGADLKNALNGVKKEISGYKLKADANGDVPLTLIHDAKISTTKNINYQTPPEIKASRKAIANGLKKTVEKNSSFNTEEVNAVLAKYLEDIAYLERLDGLRVHGGKLGKYFSQIAGNVAGGAVGGVVGGLPGSAIGTVVGGELASRLKGSMLSRTLGKATGRVAPESKILQKAVNLGKSPRLQLPAPKPGSPRISIGSGKTINLGSKSQSAIDEAYRSRIGTQTSQYMASPSKNPSKIGISNTVQQSEANGKLPLVDKLKNTPNKEAGIGKIGAVLGGTSLSGIGLASQIGSKQTYQAQKNTSNYPSPKKISDALLQLESSGGTNKTNADKGEMKWLTGLTKSAIDELKRTGIKTSVKINDRNDVIDASIKYFNLLQKRNPNLTPAEVYVDKYWTQWSSPQQRQRKIDEFNRLTG